MLSQRAEAHLLGIVLRSDRENRRLTALTPKGLWHFHHPNPSRKGGMGAKVFASALNPLCLSHLTFISREGGWGWLQSAQLEEILFPDLGTTHGKNGHQHRRVLNSLRVSTRLRRLVLLSQQPCDDCPLLFKLLLTCLRRLLQSSSPFTILAIFAVKLLMHEGRWPARPECLICKGTILGQTTQLGAEGFLCLNCQKRALVATNEIKFTGTEIDQLCGIALCRAWDKLMEFEIDLQFGEKIAGLAELILLHSD